MTLMRTEHSLMRTEHSFLLWSWTLTYDLDLGNVKINQDFKYLGVKGHFLQKLCLETQTHTRLTALPGPQKWLETIPMAHTGLTQSVAQKNPLIQP